MSELAAFLEVVAHYQYLIDIILENSDSDGVCRLSQAELAKKANRSQAWVHSTIAKVNREEECIAHTTRHYRVIHKNMLKHGTFPKILMLLHKTEKEEFDYIWNAREVEVARKYGIKVSTLQMFKTLMNIENKNYMMQE